MTIPFLDLARLHDTIREDLDAAYRLVLGGSAFIGGKHVEAFELSFAEAHGKRAGAGCGSGTDALVLALRALGVGPGDEVVVPSMTFVATAEAVIHAGATPVLADVDPDTLLLTAETTAEVVTPRTRAVVPVHLYGNPVPFDRLEAWRADGWVVVEDAAQAHLAHWEGLPVGRVSHAACFSFYPGKNLGALGDGGMVLSDDEGVVEHVRRLADHGRDSKHTHAVVGSCSRLDGIQSAFLLAKLAHMEAWTASRRLLARRYASHLGHGEDGGVRLVPWSPGAVHHLLVVRVPAMAREAVRTSLARSGIETGMHYPVPLSRQPALAAWSRPTPNAERAAEEILSLPMDPLMSQDEVDEVCAVLLEAVG